jgi:hypothetical protein
MSHSISECHRDLWQPEPRPKKTTSKGILYMNKCPSFAFPLYGHHARIAGVERKVRNYSALGFSTGNPLILERSHKKINPTTFSPPLWVLL